MSQQYPIVYFFSDFGPCGPYTGQVEAVIRERTRSTFINLLSNAPKADPFHSAYLLAALYEQLPVKSGYMLAVVDPGVGSERRVIMFEIGSMAFLGPDNGLFSRLIAAHNITQVSELQRPAAVKSNSFHARDWFAPELASLINEESHSFNFIAANRLVGHNWPDEITAIIYVDHYGNLMTGLPASKVSSDDWLLLAGRRIAYARTFSQVSPNTLFWYENSMGLVEIAANRDSAADILQADVGAKLELITG